MSGQPVHDCPGGCTPPARVDYAMLACKPCWWRLPKPYRDALNTAHRKGGPAHRAALAAALRWYRKHPPEAADA